MSGHKNELVDHTVIELVKLNDPEVTISRKSTLTQRQPPNPYKNKRKIVAFATIVIVALTVWSCIAAYHVVKHLVWGPDVELDESRAGAEIHVPSPFPLSLADIQWRAANIDEHPEKRSADPSSIPSIACVVLVRAQRLQQVLSTTKTWLPVCDFHALIAFGSIPEQLNSSPSALITQQHPHLERCSERIALNLSSSLFPEADWHFLASDDSFVLVPRLQQWLLQHQKGSYVDLSSAGRPSLLVKDSALRSLNLTICESATVASLLKRQGFKPIPTFDSEKRPIVLNKFKTDNQHSLSPQLSIVQSVTPSEMILLNHLYKA
ncbi:hypothetical protein PMAYCL1PPCAC_05366 [Pristionchus mayeri]|uniref:Uncharacterized protein n=1 Tax=Pristionchus mayeri TaxID=1317129 RepID=A0AAN4Z9Z8_9BILA|nr:hypothetical protein PMAYCL1PPCAC_05366 [Pristionchus mayeri]